MSIPQLLSRCKRLIGRIPVEFLGLIVAMLFSTLTFIIGYTYGQGQGSERAVFSPLDKEVKEVVPRTESALRQVEKSQQLTSPASGPVSGGFVASKNGSKYYAPWCGTVSRIKEENKVWFATEAEAITAGFEKAANCKF